MDYVHRVKEKDDSQAKNSQFPVNFHESARIVLYPAMWQSRCEKYRLSVIGLLLLFLTGYLIGTSLSVFSLLALY